MLALADLAAVSAAPADLVAVFPASFASIQSLSVELLRPQVTHHNSPAKRARSTSVNLMSKKNDCHPSCFCPASSASFLSLDTSNFPETEMLTAEGSVTVTSC